MKLCVSYLYKDGESLDNEWENIEELLDVMREKRMVLRYKVFLD